MLTAEEAFKKRKNRKQELVDWNLNFLHELVNDVSEEETFLHVSLDDLKQDQGALPATLEKLKELHYKLHVTDDFLILNWGQSEKKKSQADQVMEALDEGLPKEDDDSDDSDDDDDTDDDGHYDDDDND